MIQSLRGLGHSTHPWRRWARHDARGRVRPYYKAFWLVRTASRQQVAFAWFRCRMAAHRAQLRAELLWYCGLLNPRQLEDLQTALWLWRYSQLNSRYRRKAKAQLRRTMRRYPWAIGLYNSIASPTGMGGDGKQMYDTGTRTWFGLMVGTVRATLNPWNDVTAVTYQGGAKLNGINIDTGPVQSAYGAVPAAGGSVFFPTGTALLDQPTNPASKTRTLGNGRRSSILKATAAFPASVMTGILNLDSASFSVYDQVDVRSIGFDTTALGSGVGTVNGFHQRATGNFSSVINTTFDDLGFELNGGGNSGGVGVLLEGLGATSSPSSAITFNNCEGRNGGGDIALYLNAQSNAGLYYGVVIMNTVGRMDINGCADDRVAVIGNYPAGTGGNAEVRNVFVWGVTANVASGLTSGRCNGFKIDCGANCNVHQISVRDVILNNFSGTNFTNNSPIDMLLTGGTSTLQDWYIDGVFSYQGGRSQFRGARGPNGQPVFSLKNIRTEKSIDATATFEMYYASANSGDEMFSLRDFNLGTSAAVVGNLPVGIMFTSGAANQGFAGEILVSNGVINGSGTGISNNIAEGGGAQLSAYSRFLIQHVAIGASTQLWGFGAGTAFTFRDCNINPWGLIGAPPAVPASGVDAQNQTGFDVVVYVSTGVGVTVSQIQIGDQTVTGLTMAASSILAVRIPSQQKIKLTYAGGAPTWQWFGE